MKIRKFKPGDLDQILQIEKQSFPKSPWDAYTFTYCYEMQPEGFLVAEEGGKLVGYIIASPSGYISSIAVATEKRRKGIGRKLIEQIIARFRPAELRAHCRVSNIVALQFYKKLGFVKVGIVKNYYLNGEDAIELVKPLK